MLRSIASSSRAAAAAAAAAVATPSVAHTKAADETVTGEAKAADKAATSLKQQQHQPGPPPPDAITATPVPPTSPTDLDGWVDAAAAVGDGDIEEAVRSVLQVVAPVAPPVRPSIRELGATDDEEEVPTPAGVASPNSAMAAADAQLAGLASSAAVRRDFETALTSLLQNPEVRTACTRALAADPAFAGLLRTVGDQVDLPVASLLPAAAQAAARTGRGSAAPPAGDPLAAFFDALAEGLIRLGKEMTGAAGAVGKFVIDAGYRVNRLVTAPFGAAPHYRVGDAPAAGSHGSRPRRPSADAPLGSPEFWMDVLTTVACAVVAVLVAKRLPRVRPSV